MTAGGREREREREAEKRAERDDTFTSSRFQIIDLLLVSFSSVFADKISIMYMSIVHQCSIFILLFLIQQAAAAPPSLFTNVPAHCSHRPSTRGQSGAERGRIIPGLQQNIFTEETLI